jgi:hypothetical protein
MFEDRVYTSKEQKYGIGLLIGVGILVIVLLSLVIWLATRKTDSGDVESAVDVSKPTPAADTPAGTPSPAAGTSADPTAPAPGPIAPKPTETSKRYACPAKTTSVCDWTTEKDGDNRCEAKFTEKGCFKTTAQEDCAKWGTWVELDDTKNPYTCLSSSMSIGGGGGAGSGGFSSSGVCNWTNKDWKTQTAQFSSTCNAESAKRDCELSKNMKWIPLDYATNPYTCQNKLAPFMSNCVHPNDCDSGSCENGVCKDIRCGPAHGDKKCPVNRCCSVGGFCGTTSDHCTNRANSNYNGSGA